MKYLIYPVIILGMSIQLSYATDGNDLTTSEEEAVHGIMQSFNISEEIGVDNENVILTQEMANKFPVSALEKMIRANEAAIAQPDYPQNQIPRLQQELGILKQAHANKIN